MKNELNSIIAYKCERPKMQTFSTGTKFSTVRTVIIICNKYHREKESEKKNQTRWNSQTYAINNAAINFKLVILKEDREW